MNMPTSIFASRCLAAEFNKAACWVGEAAKCKAIFMPELFHGRVLSENGNSQEKAVIQREGDVLARKGVPNYRNARRIYPSGRTIPVLQHNGSIPTPERLSSSLLLRNNYFSQKPKDLNAEALPR